MPVEQDQAFYAGVMREYLSGCNGIALTSIVSRMFFDNIIGRLLWAYAA